MNWDWLLIRGTGLAAFAFLSVSTVWGLLLSTKVLGRAVRAKGLSYFHESLGIGSLLLTAGHLVAVYRDEFIGFTWPQILLPGLAEWRPYAVAYGVMAFYGLAAVTVSSFLRARIGLKAWRTLHLLSLGAFVAALLHGVLAGSDSGEVVILMGYVGLMSVVAVLLAIRVAAMKGSTRSSRSKPTTEHPELTGVS